MNQSIFSFIKSYTPSVDRDPKEDYLTQIFSWILNNINEIDKKYLTYLINKINIDIENMDIEDSTLSVDTQASVTSGRIDMVISLQYRIGFICEHKVWSNLSHNQINKYKECSHELGSETYYTVLITANKLQHTQEADVKLTWADIGIFIEGIMNEYENEEKFVLSNFIDYLKEQGLWKYEAISMCEITSYYAAKSLESKIDELFEGLIMVEWDKECPNIKTFTKSSYNPKFNKYRWGRKGIDFFEQWQPGLFAGVMLDPTDHNITISDKDKGPDLVVILDINRKEDASSKIINSEEYRLLLQELKTMDNGFELVKSKNKWRLAIIRKPLIDVLNGKYANDEQLDAIKNVIAEGINALTNIKLS